MIHDVISEYQDHLPGSSGTPQRLRETNPHLGALSVVSSMSNSLVKYQFRIQLFITSFFLNYKTKQKKSQKQKGKKNK